MPWGRAAAAGVAAFCLYAATAGPTIHWKDSAEFTTAVHWLDVAHPAGSPVYALLAKLFALAPIGDLALRVNFFSAFAAAAAVALLLLLAEELLAILAVPAPRRTWIALASAAWLGLAPAFRTLASTTEVYSLQTAFVAGVFLLLLRWRRTRGQGEGDLRLLCAAALLYGVSAGSHAALGFLLPGFVAFGAVTLRGRLLAPRVWLPLGVFFLIGLSVYAYLPLRASTDRLIYNWGDPVTWERFLDHVLDRKDAGIISSFSISQLPAQLRLVGGFALDALSVPGALLGAAGFAVLVRRAADVAVLTAGALAVYTAFFIRYWATPDIYMPAFLAIALWSSAGLAAALQWVERRAPSAGPRWAAVAVALAALWHGAAGWERADKSADRAAYALASESFMTLPEGAMALPVWQWFQLVYLQEIEGRRPDLQVLGVGELKRPQWFRSVSAERFPDLTLPEQPLTAANFSGYAPALIGANIAERRVFIELDHDTGVTLRDSVVPRGFIFEVLPAERMASARVDLRAYFDGLGGFLRRELDRPGFLEDYGAAKTYSMLAGASGIYFLNRGAAGPAIAMFTLAGVMDPHESDAEAFVGMAHHSVGELDDAEKHLRGAVAVHPRRSLPRVALGNLLMDRKRWDEAEGAYRAALALDPGNAQALLGVGFAAMERGDYDAAEAEFVRAGRALEGGPRVRDAERALESVRRARSAARAGASEGTGNVPG